MTKITLLIILAMGLLLNGCGERVERSPLLLEVKALAAYVNDTSNPTKERLRQWQRLKKLGGLSELER